MFMDDVLKFIEQGAKIQLAFTTLISSFFFFNFFAIHLSSKKIFVEGRTYTMAIIQCEKFLVRSLSCGPSLR